jgi:hypothetical protein
LFQRLRTSEEFRMTFADRVRKQLFGDGALTPDAAARRYRALSDPLDVAVVGESARWGSYRRDVHQFRIGPYEWYTREAHVRPEVDRLMREYFPRRTAVVLGQFRKAGLYPAVEAPEARVEGGRVFLDTAAGTAIYFTTDGSDPRLPGGKVAPTARQYAGPIPAAEAKGLKARATAGGWSALTELTSP